MHPDLYAALAHERILQRRQDAANARHAALARQAARAGREHPPDRAPDLFGAARAELGFLLIEAGLRLALAGRPPGATAPGRDRPRARRPTARKGTTG